jgi:hypothetical protein
MVRYAIAGAGALDRNRDVHDAAGLDEGSDVVFPRALVEIGGEIPACLVFEEQVHADDKPALQVVEHNLVANGNESLVRTFAAFASRL